MAESWIQVSLVCVLVSVVLQLVAITTPGWAVTNDTARITKLYLGIFYVVICRDGTCTSESIPSWYGRDGIRFNGLIVYGFVTGIFNVLLTWLLTVIVACMKVIVVAKRRTWPPAFTSVCMTFLAIANTLQWQIVGQYANHSVVFADGSTFPWCISLAGLGALLVSGVLLMHIVMFVKQQLKPALSQCRRGPSQVGPVGIKVSLVCALLSMVLQLVAITTPGWAVANYTPRNTKVYLGIFYAVICRDGTCTSESFPSWSGEGFSGTVVYNFVRRIFNVLLTWLLTLIVACMMGIVVAKRRTWAPAFTPVCMTFLAIANTLQWQIVGQYANLSVVAEASGQVRFPWCVFLAGLGALLVSGVLLVHIVMFVKQQLKPALSGFNNDLNTDGPIALIPSFTQH